MRETRLALAIALVLAVAASASARSSRGPIPWLPTRPPRVAEPPLAPPCHAGVLRGELFLQGATGSLVGGVTVRNVGRVACSILGRPHARLVGGNAGKTAWRTKLVASSSGQDLNLVYDRASSLRALTPGRTAYVPIYWSNWCPPGTAETTPGVAPRGLELILPGGRGVLRMPLHGLGPRCDQPTEKSLLQVGPFTRVGRQLPPSTHLRVTLGVVGVPSRESKLVPPRLRVRRGSLLRFTVAVTNASERPLRLRHCPTYVEQLSPRGHTEIYVLNCHPMGTLRPHAQALFRMVLRVPTNAPLGPNGLFWELAPTSYLPPSVGTRVLVTR